MHVAEPVDASVGEADGEPEVGVVLEDELELDVDDVPETNEAIGGPGKVY